MTLTTPYSATFYVGDGETKTFPYLFEEVSESFISVIVYNSLTGQSSTPTYIVDTDQKQVIFGDDTPAPTADETVCIYRNTPNVQDTPFRTLQGYDAKALENILSKIVAMIQEIKSNYFTTQVLQGDPWQLDLLTSADDGATVNIDYTAKKLVKGLYFQINNGNLQVSADGSSYITMPKSDDIAEFRQFSITLEDLSVIKKLQYRVGNEWFDAETNAQATADEALALAQTVQGGLSSHVSDTNNPHDTSVANLKDTNITSPISGQFIMFDGLKWKNVNSSATAGWGTIIGNITDQTDLMNKFTEYVKTDGSSTMTNPLMMRATEDFKCAIAPYWDGIGFFKLNDNNSVTLMASIEYNSGFEPATTNTYNIGASARKWKNLYLSGKAYMSVINNGYDIAVPVTNSADTLALKSEVDLAANSGRMITDQGVWYAKMYAATVAPSAENGTNYADFSQTDGQGNPIIVIYERQNGAWVQSETITPPAEYDGYVPITSKIWDITEQTGQQGGRILWNHQSKEFTPYPQIISFEDIEITGNSTVIMPQNPSASQIVNKDYVDNKVSSSIGNGTITLTQSGNTMGTFTTNQSGDTTIALDGGSSYHPDLFDVKWADHILNDASWLRADTFSWQDGTVYEEAYQHLMDDGPTSVSVTETIAGTQITYLLAQDGHKIVLPEDENKVIAIYNATGVAWYYIVDPINHRFKLPRVNPAREELIQTIKAKGSGLTLGLVSNAGYTGGLTTRANNNANLDWNGSAYNTSVGSAVYGTGPTVGTIGVTTDADKSGIISDMTDSTSVFSGKKHLYFYVGSFTQTALENTAGLNAELFNGKADTDLSNVLANIDFVVESQLPTAANNYTWYRKYKSGWVEQGGSGVAGNVTITLPIPMANDHYTATMPGTTTYSSTAGIGADAIVITKTTTTIKYGTMSAFGFTFDWQVSGMAAS